MKFGRGMESIKYHIKCHIASLQHCFSYKLFLDLDDRCGRVQEFPSDYLISIFCSCSSHNNLSLEGNFKIIKKIFFTSCSKFIDLLYCKPTIMLLTLFTNPLTSYGRKKLKVCKTTWFRLHSHCFELNSHTPQQCA